MPKNVLLHESKLYQDDVQYAHMNIEGKHILQLTPRYSPCLGGVERHVFEVNKELISRGYAVTVITTSQEKSLPEHEVIDGVEVYRLTFGKDLKKLQVWQWMFAHRYLCKNVVVHVHDIAWWILPWMPIIFKNFYITFHGWEGIYPVPLTNKLQRLIFSFCAKKTVHVGGYIQKFYWDKPNLVMFGAVHSYIKKQPIQLFSFKKSVLHFVFLGRLVAENELKKYFELLTILKNKGIKTKVTWVGDGLLRNECLQYGTVTGMVEDVAKYISDGDIIFANSYLALLEAQAQGKIIVSMYSHDLKKSYLETYPGKTGIITESDVERAAQSIERLFSNTQLARQMQQTAQRFAQSQTWEKTTQDYLQLWAI